MNERTYQPKRHRRSIKLDRVKPSDFSTMEGRFFCDDCVHYARPENRSIDNPGTCTMGYVAQHTRTVQLKLYAQTGMMAFCRFLEID